MCSTKHLDLQMNKLPNLTIPSSWKNLNSIIYTEGSTTELIVEDGVPLTHFKMGGQNTHAPSEQLQKLNKTLISLTLNYRIVEIDHALLLHMQVLSNFDLKANVISSWPIVNASEEQSTIYNLILANNRLTTVNFTYLSLFTNLRKLFLEHNSLLTIEQFPEGVLPSLNTASFKYSMHFTTSNNLFKILFAKIPNVKLIYLGDKLTALPTAEEMKLIPGLENLEFANNKIADTLDLNIFTQNIQVGDNNS